MGVNIRVVLTPQLPVYFSGTTIRGYVALNADEVTNVNCTWMTQCHENILNNLLI